MEWYENMFVLLLERQHHTFANQTYGGLNPINVGALYIPSQEICY